MARGKSLETLLTSAVDFSKLGVSVPGNGKMKLMIEGGGQDGTPAMSFEFNPVGPISWRQRIRYKLNDLRKNLNSKYKRLSFDPSGYDYFITVRAEQTPNKDSTINCSKEKTEEVNWKVNDSDFISYSDLTKRLLSWLKGSELFEKVYIPGGTENNLALPNVQVDGGAHHDNLSIRYE